MIDEPVEEMAFIVGDESFFGDKIIQELKLLAKKYNSTQQYTGSLFHWELVMQLCVQKNH